MSEVLTAKIGEIQVGKSPMKLQALALGSCVGVVLYDKINKVGALAHVLLPDETNVGVHEPGKFATKAIPEALRRMELKGANRANIIAKIAGGAKMFETNSVGGVMDIGRRNIEAVIEILKKEGIQLVAQDVGENFGRTIIFDLETGSLTIRQIMNRKEYKI